MPNNIIMADPKGQTMHYNEKTGAYYPTVLDISISGGRTGDNIQNGILDRQWAYCSELKEATIDSKQIAMATKGNNIFSGCSKLERLVILGGVGSASGAYLAEDCPMLKTVVLGSVGFPCDTTPNNNLLRNSGASAVGEKTITYYVADSTPIPLANAPFGLTGATVIYRSSTTGEVRTE